MATLLFVCGCAFDATGTADSPPVDPGGQTEPQLPVDPGGADADAPAEPTAFRLTGLELRDPHMFAVSGLFGSACSDITDDGGNAVNARIAQSMTTDADADGFLDRGVALVFRPFSPAPGVVPVEIMNARCTAPAPGTSCSAETEPVVTAARNVGAPACDVPPSLTTSDYQPAIDIAVAPCFSTDPTEFALNLESPVPLTDVVVSGTIQPEGDALTGVLRGFITETEADVLEVGAGMGTTVASRLLPGGQGACANHDARDVGPGGASGWYVYFNFEAVRVALLE